MAKTLALVHWQQEIDANDAKFVLTPQQSPITSATGTVNWSVLGKHAT